MKEITDWLDCIKIKNFCTVKENIKRMRRQVTLWGLQDTFDKVLLSKNIQTYFKFNSKEVNTLIKNRPIVQKVVIKIIPKKKKCKKANACLRRNCK